MKAPRRGHSATGRRLRTVPRRPDLADGAGRVWTVSHPAPGLDRPPTLAGRGRALYPIAERRTSGRRDLRAGRPRNPTWSQATMPTVTVEGEKSFEVEPGKKLVLAVEDAGIDILHRCGGNARCTTCRVQVVSGEPGPMEELERT